MSDQDLFNKERPKDEGTVDTKQENQPNTDNSIETYLGLITNPDGTPKYATTEEALKGAVHAQSHISNLEKELNDLRKVDHKDASMVKILEALEGKSKTDDEPAKDNGVTKEALAELVTQLVDERASVSTQETNVTTVTSKFTELYGDKASEIMYGKANDLGFGKDEINRMIATNPNAALKILGVEQAPQKKTDLVATDTSINAGNLGVKGQPEAESSMGFISAAKLQENFEASKQRTLERLGVTIDNS